METSSRANQCVVSTKESQEIFQHKDQVLPLKILALPLNLQYILPSDIELPVLFQRILRNLRLGDLRPMLLAESVDVCLRPKNEYILRTEADQSCILIIYY